MGRRPCCAKEGLNRGAWTAMEDKILTDYIKLHGEGKWRNLPIQAGLKRCGKSCRLRWLNYLKPDIKRGNITRDEEDLIIRLHNLLGNRWSLIAGRLPGRTDNEIKNYWNTNIGKRSTITTTTHHQHDEQQHIHNDRRRQTSSPTRRRSTGSKLSQQRHHKKKKKTVNIPGSKNTTPIMPAVPIPKAIPSIVVRTKATRCTKVFINSHHNNSQQILDPLKMTSSSAPNFLNHNNNHHSTTASPQNDIIINHTAAATTTTNDHVQSVTHHTPEKPQPTWPTNDLMMDLEITDAFLTTPPVDDFSSFHRLNYTLTNDDHILHQQHGPHHHNTNNNKNVDNQDRYNSSSSLSFDDQGLFLKEDDDMMTTIMEAAAELDASNNWFATFLGGGDIDFDDPLYSERGEPDVM